MAVTSLNRPHNQAVPACGTARFDDCLHGVAIDAPAHAGGGDSVAPADIVRGISGMSVISIESSFCKIFFARNKPNICILPYLSSKHNSYVTFFVTARECN